MEMEWLNHDDNKSCRINYSEESETHCRIVSDNQERHKICVCFEWKLLSTEMEIEMFADKMMCINESKCQQIVDKFLKSS